MFVEITRGRSFKGLAQYCLHDVDRKGDERVSFAETRNLGTDNPDVAWRIMAAKHYLQDELKEKAGVGRGGAKDGKPVGHLLISWKKEEAEAQQLSHQGMKKAAYGALRAIGADGHQAIIIGHTDTAHPHCHIIVNLIGEDGRLKKNWKEREKLSKFALKAEKAVHGEAIVKTREKNWLDRKAGETPAPVKKKPRHLYELDKAAKKCEQTRKFVRQHKQQLADLEQHKQAQKQRHKRHKETLLALHHRRNRKTIAVTQRQVRSSRTTVRRSYDQNWRELLNEQEAQRRSFEVNEQDLKGSLSNAMKLINWKLLLRRKREPNQLRLGDAFQILTKEGARRDQLKQQQQAEQEKLRSRQRQEEQAKEQALQKEQEAQLRGQRKAYVRKADAMKKRQARSHERLKEQQQQLTRQRNEVLKAFRDREQQRKLDRLRQLRVEVGLIERQQEGQRNKERLSETPQVERQAEPKQIETALPTAAIESKPTRTRRERQPRQPRQPRAPRKQRTQTLNHVAEQVSPAVQRPEKQKTQAIDILPQDENAPEIARMMDDFQERMLKQMQERAKGRKPGDRGR